MFNNTEPRHRLPSLRRSTVVRIASATAVIGTIAVAPLAHVAANAAAVVGPDSCGYPLNAGTAKQTAAFNENELTRHIDVYGTGVSATIAVFSNDESGILLGQSTNGVGTPTPFVPGANVYEHVPNPNLGDTSGTGVDAATRPVYPSLFLTDVTANPGNPTANDWQNGGTGTNFISDVFGSWDTAVKTTAPAHYTVTKPAQKNHWTLGPGADTPAGGFAALTDEGYGNEFRWNVSTLGLIPGHTYRIQVMTHDGDQNKGTGDVGELCTNILIPPTNVTTHVKDTATNTDITGTTVPIGTDVYDSVQVDGNAANGAPTGNVTFNFFTNGNCTAPSSTSHIVALGATAPPSNNAIANTSATPETGLAAGDYSFKASYAGDVNYPAAIGDCETFSIGKLTPSVDTTVEDPNNTDITGDTVTIPITVHDVATITGNGTDDPTGVVNFDFFSDDTCTPADKITTDTNKAVTPDASHNGTATSDNHAVTTIGTGSYSFKAHYDGSNDPIYKSQDGSCEVFDVQNPILPPPPPVLASPSLTTSATSVANIPAVALGGPNPTIQDVATLTNGNNPTGTVTFRLFGPLATNTADCTGTALATVTAPVAGGQAVSPAVPVSQVGFYYWLASYGGDGNNNPANGTCGDAGETSQAVQGDLGLSKTGLSNGPVPTSPSVQPGDVIHYTITMPNSGASAITGAVLTDTLPPYVTVDTSSISNGGVFTAGNDITTSAGKIVWSGLTIPAAGTVTETYDVTVNNNVPAGTVLTNLAQVGSLSATTHHQVANGDLAITKKVDKGSAQFGGTLTYTLDIAANGTLDEDGVVVTDIIPGYDPTFPNSGKTTYVDGSAGCTDAGKCVVKYDASTHTLTWELGTIKAGASRQATFQVTIDTPAGAANGAIPPETIRNSGSVLSNRFIDPVVSNVVKTNVVAVLGEKHQRHQHSPLPFTGAIVNPRTALVDVLIMVALGSMFLVIGRRREDGMEY